MDVFALLSPAGNVDIQQLNHIKSSDLWIPCC